MQLNQASAGWVVSLILAALGALTWENRTIAALEKANDDNGRQLAELRKDTRDLYSHCYHTSP